MTVDVVAVSPEWLTLREPADAAARSTALVERVTRHLPAGRPLIVHDLGCGTGSMARWLAPQLPGPQHWVLRDLSAPLLAIAAQGSPSASDGSTVTVETRRADVTRLDAGDLAGADLITAAALLDMLTADEVSRLVAACAAARCPALLTLSVVGRVELTPREPLDAAVESAFNAHQRRAAGGRRLLGPDAAAAATTEFRRLGADVQVRPSPWRLGADQLDLAVEWFRGWVAAACEQQPELAGPAAAYTRRRLDQAVTGRLDVTVHHQDLLAWPADLGGAR